MLVEAEKGVTVDADRLGRPTRLTEIDWEAFDRLRVEFEDRDYQVHPDYLRSIVRERGERLRLFALGLDVTGSACGLVAVRARPLPVVGGGVALVAGSPLVARHDVTDPSERAATYRQVLEAVDAEFASSGVRVHCRPSLLSTMERWFDASTPCVGRRSDLLEPYRTMVIDLSSSEEELRSALSSQWRRHLRHAEKAGLTVATVAPLDGWRRLRPLYDAMRVRKSFDSNLDSEFWTGVLSAPSSADVYRVVLVSIDDEVVAGVVAAGDGAASTYVLGASSTTAHPSRAGYLAQFAAVVDAKAAGYRFYDLGGVDPVANPGGWQFKNGMRGTEVECGTPIVLAGSGVRGFISRQVEQLAQRRRANRGRPQETGE